MVSSFVMWCLHSMADFKVDVRICQLFYSNSYTSTRLNDTRTQNYHSYVSFRFFRKIEYVSHVFLGLSLGYLTKAQHAVEIAGLCNVGLQHWISLPPIVPEPSIPSNWSVTRFYLNRWKAKLTCATLSTTVAQVFMCSCLGLNPVTCLSWNMKGYTSSHDSYLLALLVMKH